MEDGPLHHSLDPVEAADARRFWSNVIEGEKCWTWNRPVMTRLGPRFPYKGNDIKIARMAFFFSQGFWPFGGAVRTCGNGQCCRPKHIVDLPQKDVPGFLVDMGRHRSGRRPRISVCKRGHPMEGDNLIISNNGRACRNCFNMNRRLQYKRALEARSNGLHPYVAMQELSVQNRRKAVPDLGAGSFDRQLGSRWGNVLVS